MIVVTLMLGNLLVLASSRLRSVTRIVAVQGVAAGLLPLCLGAEHHTLGALVLVGVTVALRGIVFPSLLYRAIRVANVRRDVELYVSQPVSILLGIALLGGSCWVSGRLPLPTAAPSALMVPVALTTALTGLMVIVSRVKAVSQVLGYLMLEIGISVFGAAALPEQPLLVELGVLLDAFVAVFVMGIMIFHISREFDHIDTQAMDELADWTPTEDRK
jgi:hydrogenase-4 component E